jgi:transposase InsO family protein
MACLACAIAALTDLGARHKQARFRRPQTNRKSERFNRTLLDEWAYVRPSVGCSVVRRANSSCHAEGGQYPSFVRKLSS